MRVFVGGPRRSIVTIAASTLLSALPLAYAQEGEEQQVFVEPGDPLWLGDYGDGDGTPPIDEYLPITYTVFGANGTAIPRVLVDPGDPCPEVVLKESAEEIASTGIDKASLPKSSVRTVGTNVLPSAFPIKVCEVVLRRKWHKLWSAGILHFDGIEDNVVIPTDPKKFVLVGDTGLRVKPDDLGLGTCKDSGFKLYDIPQCPVNFTEDDLSFPAIGDYQDLSDWPLKALQDLVAGEDPDVVVYVGDYLYRQGPCPANNTEDETDCTPINGPQQYFNASTDLSNGTIANFLPGNWGDNLYGWWADFFFPSLNMLKTAPLIATRGNHENCARAGRGYYVFMSGHKYPDNRIAGDYCEKYEKPFAIPFEHEQFLLNDDSEIEPRDGGIDDFVFVNGSCPPKPGEGDPPIVAVPQNRFTATSPPQKNTLIEEQLAVYSRNMEVLRQEALKYDTNFYVSHRPIFAIACNDTDIVTLDWTIQESLAPNTLDRVSACIDGHMHWMEALIFEENALPPQIVVGHGGTKLIDNYVVQDAIPGIELEVGRNKAYKGTVERGITSSEMFGFGVMERDDDTGDYDVTFWGLDEADELVKVDFEFTIPKGPRVKAPVGETETTTLSEGGGGPSSTPAPTPVSGADNCVSSHVFAVVLCAITCSIFNMLSAYSRMGNSIL